MSNSKSTKIILTIISILFILAVAGVIISFNYVQNLAEQVRVARMQVNGLTSQSHNLTQMKKMIVDIQGRQILVDQILLDDKDTVLFIEKIEEIGRLSGVVVEIQFVDTVADGSYGKLNMIFSAQGSWQNVSRFLNLIENLPNHSTINSIKFDTVNSNSGVVWNMITSITVITN